MRAGDSRSKPNVLAVFGAQFQSWRMPVRIPVATQEFRFSGHETFPCRYTWLPKAARFVQENPKGFANEDEAMVELGVGKNMVRSMRFWAETARVIEGNGDAGYQVTPLGRAIFIGTGNEEPLDPFLEDVQTLWLIHWNISTLKDAPIFGWDFLLNRWQAPYLSVSTVENAFVAETSKRERPPSKGTLAQMFEVFVHTYLPTRGRKGEVREDNLDCPLVELQLLIPEGVRQTSGSDRHEPVFKFRREVKPEISPALFAYCLDDYWRQQENRGNLSIGLQSIVAGHGGPGQVFKLPEEDIRARAETLHADTEGFFSFNDSSALPNVTRKYPINKGYPLSAIYAYVHD